jgi:hypothetical protein
VPTAATDTFECEGVPLGVCSGTGLIVELESDIPSGDSDDTKLGEGLTDMLPVDVGGCDSPFCVTSSFSL